MKSEPEFKLIDLSYMKQISRGDLDYERQVTKLFIEIIPENIISLEIYFELKSYDKLKKTLHHMQSSMAIMGLDKKLSKYLNRDFYERGNDKAIKENIEYIVNTCDKAIDEAKDYLSFLN